MPKPSNKRNDMGARLSKLQPVDEAAFKHAAPAALVWGSLLVVWMASLLPWRLWQPVPDVLLLFLVYWSFHEPQRVGLFTAFVMGLLMDVQDSSLLGLHALSYVLSCYAVLLLRRRLMRFPALVQMVHILPLLVLIALLTSTLGSWLNAKWIGWDWLWSILITGALWPVLDFIMSLPFRYSGSSDVGT